MDELALLSLTPRAVLIVENLETGLALPEMPGVVALMKLGNAVGALARLPWARSGLGVYWDDMDTHGFAILNRARTVLPQLTSPLMDEYTLTAHRALWVEEPAPCSETALSLLTADERLVFDRLRASRWGPRVRLEQERIPWSLALQQLEKALGLERCARQPA